MFTGIIEAVGEVAQSQRKGGDISLKVRTGKLDMSDVNLGDSIATNGVCLTVTRLEGNAYWADVSAETLAHTTLSHWQVGQAVNLEKALTPQSRLGGHLVSGHVDAVGEITAIWPDARSIRYKIKVSAPLMRYIALKGSITVDGTSLTVTGVDDDEFELSIVPHTAAQTIMRHYQVGQQVNVEVDQIARYLERLLQPVATSTESKSSLTQAWLAEQGFGDRRR
ncbi:riboflavin synthase [Maribrevibacterium harenarium]|uniref:Riboflavin synthase n=1 Tax=Maribrevibacterium harenarium TaxID=2589817 RepID=A0A501WZU4_9GAMM|nr:riboflavin synthase [Maribrevibacterium harenarium]TPE54044.1 riboflavin synthase [Maribrevibacterium harenarium]